MKKNLLLVLIGFAVISLVGPLAKQVGTDAKIVDRPLENAFHASGCQFFQAKVQGWAQVAESNYSIEELQRFGDMVEGSLQLKEPLERKSISDEDFNSLEMTGVIAPGITGEFILQSLSDDGGKSETYLIVNITDSRGPEALVWGRKRLEDAFRVFEKQPVVNLLLAGFHEGLLDQKISSKRVNAIFQAAGGKMHDGIEEENYISMTGYVPNLPNEINVNGQKTNLQVAASYNDLEDRTYFYLGSPLVYTDY